MLSAVFRLLFLCVDPQLRITFILLLRFKMQDRRMDRPRGPRWAAHVAAPRGPPMWRRYVAFFKQKTPHSVRRPARPGSVGQYAPAAFHQRRPFAPAVGEGEVTVG